MLKLVPFPYFKVNFSVQNVPFPLVPFRVLGQKKLIRMKKEKKLVTVYCFFRILARNHQSGYINY